MDEGYYEDFKYVSLVDLVYNLGVDLGKLNVTVYFEVFRHHGGGYCENFKDIRLVVLARNWLSLATTHLQEENREFVLSGFF